MPVRAERERRPLLPPSDAAAPAAAAPPSTVLATWHSAADRRPIPPPRAPPAARGRRLVAPAAAATEQQRRALSRVQVSGVGGVAPLSSDVESDGYSTEEEPLTPVRARLHGADAAPRAEGDGGLCADLWLHWVLPCLDYRTASYLGATSRFLRAITAYEPHWEMFAAQFVRPGLADALPCGHTFRDVVAANARVSRTLRELRKRSRGGVVRLIAGSTVHVRHRSASATSSSFVGAFLCGGQLLWWDANGGVLKARRVVPLVGPGATPCDPSVLQRRHSAMTEREAQAAAARGGGRLRTALSFARTSHDTDGDTASSVPSACSTPLGELPVLRQPQCVVAYKPTRTLAVATADRSVTLLCTETLQPTAYLKGRAGTGHSAAVTTMALNRRHLFTASFDNTLKLWSLRTRRVERTLQHHSEAINKLLTDMTEGPGAPSFVSLSHGDVPRMLSTDMETGQVVCKFSLPAAPYQQFIGALEQVDRRGTFAAGMQGSVSLYDLRTADPIATIRAVKAAQCSTVQSLAVAGSMTEAPGLMYAGGGEAASGITCLDMRAGRVLWHVPDAHDRRVTSLQVEYAQEPGAPHDPILISGSWDSTVKVWDGSTAADQPRLIRSMFEGQRGGVLKLTWDGLRLVCLRSQSIQIADLCFSDSIARQAKVLLV